MQYDFRYIMYFVGSERYVQVDTATESRISAWIEKLAPAHTMNQRQPLREEQHA
jgi:hypothetical protein